MFLKNRNISSKIKRSKVTDYAALKDKKKEYGDLVGLMNHLAHSMTKLWQGREQDNAVCKGVPVYDSSLLQGDCLCIFGLVDASVGFPAFWSHLRFVSSHDRPTRQPCIGPTRFCMRLQQCVETKRWRHNPTAV